MLFRMV